MTAHLSAASLLCMGENQGGETFKIERPFQMKMGGTVEEMEFVYETWGEPNEEELG